MKYKVCKRCSAHLDHGESCDCMAAEKEAAPRQRERPRPKNILTLSIAAVSVPVNAYCEVIGDG